MTRKLLTAVTIVVAGGFVVAMLQAQESSSAGTSSGEPFGQRSVLKRTTDPGSASVSPTNPPNTSSNHRQSGGRMVDRLKRIRGSASDTAETSRNLAPPRRTIGGPSRDTGRRQPSISIGDSDSSRSEPRLLSTPSADPRGQRAGSRLPGNPPATSPQLSTERFSDRGTSARRPRPARAPRDNPALGAPENGRTIGIQDAGDDGRKSAVHTFREFDQPSEITPLRGSNQTGALLTSAGPAIQVETVGPKAIMVGTEAEFKVSLTNQNQLIADDVFVRIAIPAGVEIAGADKTVGDTQVQTTDQQPQELIWRVTQLGGGAREALSLKLIPRENRSFNLAVDWTLRPMTAVAQIQVQKPDLKLAVLGPQQILYGETAIYTIQLTNPGTGDAEDVRLDFGYGTERLPTKRIASLPAGDQTEVRVELSARQAGALRVEAAATAVGGISVNAAQEVWVRRANLEVIVRGNAVKYAGSTARYSIQVRNVGDAPAEAVVAEIVLPPGAKYVSRQRAANAEKALLRQLGSISANSERTFELECELTSPGENRVEARARAAGNIAAANAFVTHVKTIADLKLTVNDPRGPIPIEEETVYELKIINRGTQAAHQVQVIAAFSDGIEPIRHQGLPAQLLENGQVLFQPIPRIAPGEEVNLRVTAKASVAGNHRFRAEVKCQETDELLSEEETTHFFDDSISTVPSRGGRITR